MHSLRDRLTVPLSSEPLPLGVGKSRCQEKLKFGWNSFLYPCAPPYSNSELSFNPNSGGPLDSSYGHYARKSVSSPGGFHPQALSEPDLNLSIHPAPIIQPNRISPSSSVQIDEAPCEQELLAIYPLLYDLSFSCTCFLPTELRLC